jgi:hypothetical protein
MVIGKIGEMGVDEMGVGKMEVHQYHSCGNWIILGRGDENTALWNWL